MEKTDGLLLFSGDFDKELFNRLLNDDSITKFDFFEDQKKELRKTKLYSLSPREQDEYLNKAEPTWVYYPWDRTLIKIVSEKDFIAIRTSRNLYKITAEEQALLSSKKVGVVGLSVGRTVSLTMALERTFEELRIADFDTIELSNLNRLKTPLKDYNLAKTVSTKREILGIDPFLSVKMFSKGLQNNNIDEFFTGGGKLDLVIDECDSLEIKILIRKKAKELGIPVLMDTSDRGMIDIERYDLDNEIQYFNGLIGDFDPPYNFELGPEEKAALLGQVIDFENLSDRAKLSIQEIGGSISTWPQLASSVVMGGGVTANVVRRIFLNETIKSGRYYIDLSNLIPNAER
ncbi:MAG: ThiF family adenylyltransferase [Salibacteraceae bacterium]